MKSSQHALKTVQRSAIAPALMSFPDAQAYLGNVSRSTLKVLRGRGDVIAINLNRRVAFTRESLDELAGPFEKMADELTPYYQERMRWLTPQQRQIGRAHV